MGTSTSTRTSSQYDYDFAPAWGGKNGPKEGDVLEGKIDSIDTGNSAWGPYPIVTVEQADGNKLAFHAFHQAARSTLARHKPAVGDSIGIKFMGEKKSTQNPTHSYKVYRIKLDTAAGGYDWSQDADPTAIPEGDGDVPY